MPFKKGDIPWNKGTKGICKSNAGSIKKGQLLSENTKNKISKSLKEYYKSHSHHQLGKSSWNKDKHLSEETKRKIGLAKSKPKTKITCIACGKEFFVKPCKAKNRKFCSLKCFGIKKTLWNIDKNWLRKEYIDKEKSTYIIAKEINCNSTTINENLKKFNIPLRSANHPRTKLNKQYIYANIKIVPNGCWEWQKKIHKITGYGCLNYKGNNFLAHRISYEIFKGKIPIGLVIDHLCKNRKCVNPEHLEIVSLKENIHRGNGVSGINFRKTECIRGHLLSGINLYITSDGRRQCRVCHRNRVIQNYSRKHRYILKRRIHLASHTAILS